MRSIKTKLIWVLAGVVIIALISSGTLLIWFNAREMRKEIFLDVLSFAELTNNSIVTSFEQFYQNGNFLQFRRDVNPLLSKNIDVSRLEVIGKSGELLYDSSTETEVPYDGSSRTKDYGLERVRSVKPSLLFDGHQIVFVRKSAEQEWLAVTEDDQIIDFPEGKVVDIIFPHRNARLSVVYQLDYSALWNRTAQMAISVLGVLAAGIFLASFFGISFAGRLLRPLKELERGVVQIGKGAFGSQVVVSSNDEIGILAQNFNQMSKTL
ncbi:MAG: HAMP domain-containing protein, partial [bacterium]|nr:HAMP domain-containing protein [bacterium]